MGDLGEGITEYPILVVTFIVGATVLVLVYISSLLKSKKQEENQKTSEANMVQKEKAAPPPPPSKSSKKKHEKWGRDSKQAFSHPWLLTSLKGHTGSVLDMDFSSNGKFLATCAEEDRAILIWSTKDWNQKEHKSMRINVEFDHATHVRWSPDSKAFVIHKAMENEIDVYKINKRPDGWIASATKHLTFPKYHENGIVGLGIACNGKFMMSCSEKTDLILLDLKGQLLTKVDTYLMNTYQARISPCGRFVAASGFTPDVKVWEVVFTKSGEFNTVSRAFELTGHSSGVYDFAFNTDSSVMATVSKDGTWKAFNTKIEYQKGEDPHLLVTGKYEHVTGPARIALSPNGEVVVISEGSTLFFYSVLTAELDAKIENVYSGPITRIQFDATGKLLLTAGVKHVRVFHNVTGYRVSIASTRAKSLKSGLSTAQKDRMEQQIKEAQNFLKELGERFE